MLFIQLSCLVLTHLQPYFVRVGKYQVICVCHACRTNHAKRTKCAKTYATYYVLVSITVLWGLQVLCSSLLSLGSPRLAALTPTTGPLYACYSHSLAIVSAYAITSSVCQPWVIPYVAVWFLRIIAFRDTLH
jgi:hypothetical protein